MGKLLACKSIKKEKIPWKHMPIIHLSHRLTRFLEKSWLQRDDENTYLLLEAIVQKDDALSQLQGHSITYRIAMGPQKGCKVLTLQSFLPSLYTPRESDRVAKQTGFSLHAGVIAEPHQRDVLERLCRISFRPAQQQAPLTGHAGEPRQGEFSGRGMHTGKKPPPNFAKR